jgi:hypothetical protein
MDEHAHMASTTRLTMTLFRKMKGATCRLDA